MLGLTPKSFSTYYFMFFPLLLLNLTLPFSYNLKLKR